MDRHLIADLEQCIVGNTAFKFLFCDLVLEAINQCRTRLTVDDVPHLGLAEFTLDAHRIVIVRMHLHREIILRIDEFDEQREIREPLRMFTEDSLAGFIKI